MLSKLLLVVPLVFQTAPPPNSALPAPPVKMGLWEATITTAAGTTMKTQSCLTPKSYQRQFGTLPPGCTMSNLSVSSTSASADVSCTMQNGTSTGHFDAQFPDSSTAHTTITVTMNMGGRTMPMTITSDAHFVSADCGDIQPGSSKVIH